MLVLLAVDCLEDVLLLCDADDDLVFVFAVEALEVAGCFLSLVDLFTVLLVLLLLLFSLFTGVVFLVVVVVPVSVSVLPRLVVVLLFTVPLLVFVFPLFTVPLLLVPVDCCWVLFVRFTVPVLRLFAGVVVVLFVFLFTLVSLPLDVEVLPVVVVPLFTLVLFGALAGLAVLSEFLTTSGLYTFTERSLTLVLPARPELFTFLTETLLPVERSTSLALGPL